MTDSAKIIERIRKCLALGKSSNVHEAATAMETAQRLIERYRIDEAIFTIESGEDAPSNVGEHVIYVFPGTYRQVWVSLLGCRIAEANRLYPITGTRDWKRCLIGIGDKADAEITQHLIAWLITEVERLYEEGRARGDGVGQGKGWAASFRLGCGQEIGERVKQAAIDKRKRLMAAPVAEDYAEADLDETIHLDKRCKYALVLQSREEEHCTAVKDYVQNLKLRKGTPAKCSRVDAFARGRIAGKRARLERT